MKLAYVVKIGWRVEFMFDDMEDAGIFAVTAMTHRTENSDNEPISIKVIDLDDQEDAADD